jgi:transporter family protein
MKELNVLFALGIVVLILGVLPLIEKLTLNHLSPIQMAFLRGVAQVVVFGVLIFQGSEWMNLKSAPVSFIAYGLLQGVLIAVMLFFYFHAMQQGEASVVKTLSATSPMLTYFLAILLLNEPFSLERLAGVGLVIGGVYLLIR